MQSSRFIGAVLLIAGTAIGIGMLALPLTTGTGGFTGAITATLFWYSYMLITMLVFVDALYLSKQKNINLIGLVRQEFNPACEALTWICFLGLLYAATTAYILGGGQVISAVLEINHIQFNTTLASLSFTVILGLTVFYGMNWVDNINRILMIVLIGSFISLLLVTAIHGDFDNLSSGGKPLYLLAASPTIVLAFSPHPIIPSLREYMLNNKKVLKQALVLGSLIPLICYLIWETVVISLIPHDGDQSLMYIIKNAHAYGGELKLLSKTLHYRYHIPIIDTLVNSFALSAIITSFVGVVISVTDFLYDGLALHRYKHGRPMALMAALFPPVVISQVYPDGFLNLIAYGGVMIAIIYGIFPATMLLRRNQQEQSRGRTILMIGVIIIAIMIIALQIASTQQWLPTPHEVLT